MSTSDRSHTVRRTVIAGAAAAMLALVFSPADPAMPSQTVHPVWAIALVLAARFGARGLYAVPAVVLGVQVAEWISGRADMTMLAQLGELNVLAVLGTIAVVAGVGEAHVTRRTRLDAKLHDAEVHATEAEAAVGELAEAAIALRDRTDRSDASLAFLSDIALRLDDPDPDVAGQAALELAISRTGARGGFVQLLENGRLRTLTSRGLWSAEQLAPPAVFRDLVAVAAIERSRPVAAHEVPRVSLEDSDLAAPMTGDDGAPIGVLALRGVASTALTEAARADLAAVARWAGRSFARRHLDDPTTGTLRGGGHVST